MEEATSDQIEKPNQPRSIKSGCLWVCWLWLIGWIGLWVADALQWSEIGEGLKNGFLIWAVFSLFSLIIFIPLGWIGYAFGRLKPLRRYQRLLFLLLPACLSLWGIGSAFLHRNNPEKRFEHFTQVKFPAGANQVEAFYSGGAMFIDYTDSYTFTCSSEETDALLRAMKLEKQEDATSQILLGVPRFEFSGESQGWQGTELWKPKMGAKVGRTDFLGVYTDATHTRVHVIYGTI